MNIIIFEDNHKFACELTEIIHSFSKMPLIFCTAHKEEALKFANECEPTVYFIDIMIGNQALGFELAEDLFTRQGNIFSVFITDYPMKIEYNSFFKLNVINSIHKNSPRLTEEVHYTLNYIESRIQTESLLFSANRFEYLSIKFDDICYITTVYKAGKICIQTLTQSYIIRSSLKEVSKKLNSHFVRCHDGFIVNVKNIERIDITNKTVIFRNGKSCYYSKRKGVLLINAFEQYRIINHLN